MTTYIIHAFEDRDRQFNDWTLEGRDPAKPGLLLTIRVDQETGAKVSEALRNAGGPVPWPLQDPVKVIAARAERTEGPTI